MIASTTYTQARATFAKLCDRVVTTQEPIIIHRRHAADVALVALDELEGLLETAHLLRSPKNARRLLTALNRARKEEGHPSSPEKLRRELGLA
jgi:antitoxin YefM